MANTNDSKDKFWSIQHLEKGRTIVIIQQEKLIDFCSKMLGYYNFKDYSGVYQLVKAESKSILKDARIEDLKQDIKNYLRFKEKQEDVWVEFLKKNLLTVHFISLIELLPHTKFNVSTKDEAIFYFRNGAVRLNKTKGLSITPYEDFEGYVWEAQIVLRDFSDCGNDFENAVFKKLLVNISGKIKERYLSITSIIGYLLHSYKNPSFTKAVILLDEKIDFSGAANGGTGKTLIARALERVTPVVFKDAKQFNSKETFAFDDVRSYHRILYFDDAKMGFSLEDFYSFITGDFQVKRKYRDSYRMSFDQSPKLLISSNYMIGGADGDTDKRRRIEFEVSAYYSANYTPIDDFKHTFFDDWDEAEWKLFDNLMLRCVAYYMKNGIVTTASDNLLENKLKMRTHPEFIEFIEDNYKLGVAFDKAELLDNLKYNSPDLKHTSGTTFKRWLDIYTNAKGLLIKHYKSNCRAMCMIYMKE